MKSALEQLEGRHDALIAALDLNDPDAIAAASRDLSDALAAVQSVHSWAAEPEVKRTAKRIGRLADAAMVRVHVLADQARRRAEALALARGQSAALTYTR